MAFPLGNLRVYQYQVAVTGGFLAPGHIDNQHAFEPAGLRGRDTHRPRTGKPGFFQRIDFFL